MLYSSEFYCVIFYTCSGDFIFENPYMLQMGKKENSDPLITEIKEICPGENPVDGKMIRMAEIQKGTRILKVHTPFPLFDKRLLDICKVILNL